LRGRGYVCDAGDAGDGTQRSERAGRRHYEIDCGRIDDLPELTPLRRYATSGRRRRKNCIGVAWQPD
jgi:hypothetical protein